ncbi:glucan endo-1,3-beta-glucosidase, basic isoform-like [Vigna umbellata]|uniref:glucan endo-1,3-beta-glucosidase, basic isoform-like n=1 Tax=Vigna umbellata TaxID=87088 RepID=UPI001F5FC978|nr:glucan endo-1,3-beta-glucosidase, basic isoform-like [Vigna umbellata]
MSSLFTTKMFSFSTLVLLLQLFTINLRTIDAQVGMCYGTFGDDLPPANEVVSLYQDNCIQKMRLFDPKRDVLHALNNSNIELILGIPNIDLQQLATFPNEAITWVQNNVLDFFPNVKIKYVAVGNEVNPAVGDTYKVAKYVLPAIQNIYQAIRAKGLQDQIKVTTVIDMTMLGNTYPPSQSSFKAVVKSYIEPIIGYLVYANAPLLANVYPYYGYSSSPDHVALSYALFTSPDVVVTDGEYKYQNLFDAVLDSVHAAIDNTKIGYVEVIVSESGWPSDGGFGASDDNAKTYLEGLFRRAKTGSPRRPSKPTEIYVFSMFDENQKTPEIEKHWGVFHPNKENKFPIPCVKSI